MRLTHQLEALEVKSAHTNRTHVTRRVVAVSRARQKSLLKLLVSDPQAAAGLVLPRSTRAVLARVHGVRLESKVELAGRYRTWHSDDFSHPSKAIYRDQLVTTRGEVFTLYGAKSNVAVQLTFSRLKSDMPLSIRGYLLGHSILATKVSKAHGRALQSTAAALATTGQVNVAVVVGTFSDSTNTVDMNAIKSTFQGNPGQDAVSYFNEASYGKMTLQPSFFGPYTLPMTTSAGCSSTSTTSTLMNAANADVDFTTFRRLIFVLNCPQTVGLSSSEGPVPTPDGTITAATTLLDPTSATNPYVVIHEISHTLGTGNKHASFFVCLPSQFVAPSRFDQGCLSSEYDDPFDVLGGGPYRHTSQLDPYHKANAGWFDASQFPTVSSTGTYRFTLAPYEVASSGVLALNIPRGQTGSSLTVEYRQPIGFDSWMGSSTLCPACTVTQGASIRLAGAPVSGYSGGGDTQLIDTTPDSRPSIFYYPFDDVLDGALTPGNTFTDPEYGISIATLSADAGGLTVEVTIPPLTCTHAAPTVSAGSPSSQAVGMGQTATYALTLTNNDSAGCPENTFRYFDPGKAGLRFVASPDFLKLAPGASANISLAIAAQPSTTAGSYTFSNSDGRGAGMFYSNTLGVSAAVAAGFAFQLTAPADSTPPGSPSGLAAQALGAKAVKVTWQPATDNVGVVGYRVTSSDGYVYKTTAPTLVDPDVAAGTAYTFSVQAFDRQGNLSQVASASMTTPAKSDFTRPVAPIVTATAGDHSLTVSWSPATDNVGVAYYRISPCLVMNCVVPAGVKSFTVDGLATRTRYDLQVLAYDGDGNYSDYCCGTYTIYTAAAGATAPSQPQRFVSTAGSYHRVDLSWAASTSPSGVTGYDVYRNNRKIATVTSTSYTDTVVSGSAQYYVQAVDSYGSLSAPSSRLWFTTPSAPSTDSAAPTAEVNAPADGATVNGSVNVTASASDDVGVARVDFYVDGVLQVSSTAPPYSFTWDTTTVGDGAHWLYVLAYDAARNYGTVGGTMVTVANATATVDPPSVAIVDPTSGTSVSGPVTITATASDNVAVTSVDIAVDNATVATDANAPYVASWDASGASAGTHTITATAHNAAGKSATASVTVMHAAPDTTRPTVAIASPADGASVTGTVQVQAAASDDVGVTKVELFVDGTLKRTLSASPWAFALDTSTLGAGGHTLGVKAYDAAGNNSSAQISVTVQAAPADTTAPSAPSGAKPLLVGTTQAVLTWAASKDNVGVVAYEVYRDGAKVGESTTINYLDSGLLPGSTHAYQVVARDAAGNRSALSPKVNARMVALSTSATATLSGVVFNQQGKLLANAVAQLTVNGVVKSAKTNASGVWKLSSLPAGTYTVTCALTGYQGATTDAAVLSGQTILLVTVLSL